MTLFTVQASASEYRVFVNDIEIQDSDAFIDENSRTQMPVRKVSEILGCDVAWDPVAYEVTVTNNSDVIRMIIGKSVLYKNDDIIYMDTSARLVNDRTYIPVRYLAEALDCEIKYEKDDKAVYIVQGDSGIMEITGTEDPSINTNPRGLFAQDFSTIDPTPLADEWYTKDSIPDEILTALNKPVGYIGEKITRTIEDIGTGGSYKLANGTYTQEFMFGGNSSNFCTDAILNSSTGRLALMIESGSISSDDLWIDVTLHEMRESGNGNQLDQVFVSFIGFGQKDQMAIFPICPGFFIVQVFGHINFTAQNGRNPVPLCRTVKFHHAIHRTVVRNGQMRHPHG